MTRIDFHPSEHDRNVALHVSMNANIAEHARYVAGSLPFGDRDVAAETGPVVIGFCESWNGCDKKKQDSDGQNLRINDLVTKSKPSNSHQPSLTAKAQTSAAQCYP